LAEVARLTYFEKLRNKEISIEPRIGLVFGDGMTGYIAFDGQV